MIRLDIPGRDDLRLSHLVLDLNGTLSLDGLLLEGVAERVRELSSQVAVEILTADTHGVVDRVAGGLGVAWTRLDPDRCGGVQKLERLAEIGPHRVVAVGNGVNDVEMLREAALGIAVLGREGLATRALLAADVVSGSIADALDLLIHPLRLYATLRC